MRFFIKNMVCLSALVAALNIVGCTNKTEAPQPTTGSLAGMLSPAGVGTVTAVASGGQVFTINANPTTGAFGLKNLAPDDYRLTFLGNGFYSPPPARLVAVAAGQNLDLGTIAFRQALRGTPRGTMTLRMDDTTYTTTAVSGDMNVPASFDLRANFVHGNAEEKLFIDFPIPIRTGTLPMIVGSGGFRECDGGVTRFRNNQLLISFRVLLPGLPSSRLVITQCDTTARTIVGRADLQLYEYIGPRRYPNTVCTFDLHF